MPLIYIRRCTRNIIQSHTGWLFVYGDNYTKIAVNGFAAIACDQPNAVGIPVKRFPGMEEKDFLTDSDFDDWSDRTAENMLRINTYIECGGTVVWPLYGICTGLADLGKRAPKINDAIENFRELLELKGMDIPPVRKRIKKTGK